MVGAFIIWSVAAIVFLSVGIKSWNEKKEAGFFTGAKPPKMRDVKAYNHAVAKIWFVVALLFECIGIPLIFIQQNSPWTFVIVGAALILIIAMMVVYTKVEDKYKL